MATDRYELGATPTKGHLQASFKRAICDRDINTLFWGETPPKLQSAGNLKTMRIVFPLCKR